MTRPRAFAYSLILCSSLSLNCLTVQQTWAADSSAAATSTPAATTGGSATPPGTSAATSTTPAGTSAQTPNSPAGAAASTPAGTTTSAPAGGTTTSAGTSTGTATSTPTGAATSAPAAGASNTLAPPLSGPLQTDRSKIRNWILAAQKKGVGIGGYKRAYDDMENSVKAGEPEANIMKKVFSMYSAIGDQYHTSSKVQKDRRPGVRTGGVEPYKIMYGDGTDKRWIGKYVEEGTITDQVDIPYKKALDTLTKNERETGNYGEFMYVSDETGQSRLSPRDPDGLGRLNPRQQLKEQYEEQRKLLMYKWKGQVGGKQTRYPSQMDNIRNSNTGAYYEKSKLRTQQKQYAQQQLNERYNPQTWVQPPPNQGDY